MQEPTVEQVCLYYNNSIMVCVLSFVDPHSQEITLSKYLDSSAILLEVEKQWQKQRRK